MERILENLQQVAIAPAADIYARSGMTADIRTGSAASWAVKKPRITDCTENPDLRASRTRTLAPGTFTATVVATRCWVRRIF